MDPATPGKRVFPACDPGEFAAAPTHLRAVVGAWSVDGIWLLVVRADARGRLTATLDEDTLPWHLQAADFSRGRFDAVAVVPIGGASLPFSMAPGTGRKIAGTVAAGHRPMGGVQWTYEKDQPITFERLCP